MLGFAVIVAACIAFGGVQASAGGRGGGPGGGSGGGTLPPPFVEIVIYDGTAVPATTLVACSEPDCLGFSLPPDEWTWEVTEPQNNVAWSVANWANTKGRITLYVDGKAVSSARSGGLLVWSTTGLANGPHTVQAVAYNSQGTAGWSTPLTITVMH